MEQKDQPSLDIRQEVFRQLVESQDRGISVLQSRAQMESQFSLSAQQVQLIEREGLNKSWPPLS